MTGKELFRAMADVDDELVAEAEEKAWDGRTVHFRRKYWGAAAACLCALAFSIAAISVYQRNDSLYTDGVSETVFAPEVSDSFSAGGEEGSGQDTASEDAGEDSEFVAGAEGGEEIAAESADKQEGETNGTAEEAASKKAVGSAAVAAVPGAGEFFCTEQVSQTIQAYAGEDVRFLLVFQLYAGEEALAADSKKYQKECERLLGLGYDMEEITYWTLNENGERETKTVIAGIYTAEELEAFSANQKYGYVFDFAENEDGSEISYDKEDVITRPVNE